MDRYVGWGEMRVVSSWDGGVVGSVWAGRWDGGTRMSRYVGWGGMRIVR